MTQYFRFFVVLSYILGLTPLSHAQVLQYTTEVTIDEKGENTTTTSYQIQINNKDQNWLSEIEIHHGPNEDFQINYGQITDPTGNVVRKLKKKDIVTRNILSNQAFYQDDLVSEFDLYWNQYPHIIEYSYTQTVNEFLFVDWWSPLVDTDVKTIKSQLIVTAPADYQLNISQSDKNFTFSESTKDNQTIRSWTYSNYEYPDHEYFDPPMRDLLPTVTIVPMAFTYGIDGKSKTWEDFGNWITKLNEGIYELTPTEALVVKELINGLDDKKEIVRTLYHYLQDHTKYVNVSIDIGGLKSYPAEYVCKNKYGDCKALTTYMKALLKYANIESYASVILANRKNPSIHTELPSQQFNHVILCVPLDGDTLWLENTSQTDPFNYLGEYTHDRFALVENGLYSKLVKTPELRPEDVIICKKYQFRKQENDQWQSQVEMTLRGQDMLKIRSFLSHLDSAEIAEQLIHDVQLKEFDLIDWEAETYHRDSLQLKLTTTGNIPKPYREIGHMRVVNPLMVDLSDFETPKERRQKVKFAYPICEQNESEFQLSAIGSGSLQLPEPISHTSKYGSYITKFEQTGENIKCYEKLTILKGEIPLSEYPSFYEFISTIKTYQKKSAIIIQ